MGSNFRWSDFYPLPTGYTWKMIIIGESGLLLGTWHHQSGSNLYHLFSAHSDGWRASQLPFLITPTEVMLLPPGSSLQCTSPNYWREGMCNTSLMYPGCYCLYCPLPTYQECYHSLFSHALHIETHLLCPRSIIKIIIPLLFHTIRSFNDSC